MRLGRRPWIAGGKGSSAWRRFESNAQGSVSSASATSTNSTTSNLRSPPSYLATKDCGRSSRSATSDCVSFLAFRTSANNACRLNRTRLARLLPHRRFSFPVVKTTLRFSTIRCRAFGSSSGAPCSLPRSSTGCCSCIRAAFEPPRRNFPSDLRGIITGNRARSDRSAAGKIACFPSSLVCTSPHPPKRSSIFKFCRSSWPLGSCRSPSFRSCEGA